MSEYIKKLAWNKEKKENFKKIFLHSQNESTKCELCGQKEICNKCLGHYKENTNDQSPKLSKISK